MSIFLPYKPRRDDPNGHLVVQNNVDSIVDILNKEPTITVGNIALGPPDPVKDGDIWIATGVGVDKLTWQFVYDSSVGDDYKWCALGCNPLRASISTEDGLSASGVWLDPPTPGPAVTLPYPGIYDTWMQSHINMDANANPLCYMGIHNGSVLVIGADPQVLRLAGDEFQYFHHSGPGEFPAAVTLKMVYQLSIRTAANYPHFRNRILSVIPIRINA